MSSTFQTIDFYVILFLVMVHERIKYVGIIF
jgi:hypothetical protein